MEFRENPTTEEFMIKVLFFLKQRLCKKVTIPKSFNLLEKFSAFPCFKIRQPKFSIFLLSFVRSTSRICIKPRYHS